MFGYYLTQCSSVGFLLFLREWKHLKVGPLDMLAEIHFLPESIYFICGCKQVFISALQLCAQFIQIVKYIWQIFQPCTPLVTSKAIWVFQLFISKKFFKFLQQLIYAVQHLAARNQWTSVWSNGALCSAHISSHKDANMRFFTGRILMKLTMCTTSSVTGTSSEGKVLSTMAHGAENDA